MVTEVTFTVLGRPQPAGSKRAFVNPKTGRAIVTDAAKHSRPWKQAVAAEARQALIDATEGDTLAALLTGPLSVRLVFVIARAKSHYRTGRRSAELRDSAPMFPATRPDIDKLSRAVLDGMTGALYRDDGQIVWKWAIEEFGEPERVEVRVATMAATIGEWRSAHEFELPGEATA